MAQKKQEYFKTYYTERRFNDDCRAAGSGKWKEVSVTKISWKREVRLSREEKGKRNAGFEVMAEHP